MRRSASILALCVAAAGSVASPGEERELAVGDSFAMDPVEVTIDPARPEPITLRLDAWWGEDARRRAAFTSARMYVDVTAPEGVTVLSDSGERTPVYAGDGGIAADYPGVCDEEGCSAVVNVRFEDPSGTAPFLATVEGEAFVWFEDEQDELDVEGELTLSGPGVP